MSCNRSCCNRQGMMGYGVPFGMNANMNAPIMEGQVVEPTITKCVEQEFYHEVPHVCPQRTKIINHHVYKHTYRPSYSCCEENTVSNIQCGSCCQFR